MAVLNSHILASEALPQSQSQSDLDAVTALVSRLLSALPQPNNADSGQATAPDVLAEVLTNGSVLSDEQKLDTAHKALVSHANCEQVGGALAGVLVAKVPRQLDAVNGLAAALDATPDPAWRPPPDDPKGFMKFKVLCDLRAAVATSSAARSPPQKDGSAAQNRQTANRSPMPPGGAAPHGRSSPPPVGGGKKNGEKLATPEEAEAAAAKARIAELKARAARGELSPEEMAELQRLEGRLAELTGGSDPRIPAGGSIGPGGIILDANGNPVLGADGKPMYAGGGGGGDQRGPAGGSSGPGGGRGIMGCAGDGAGCSGGGGGGGGGGAGGVEGEMEAHSRTP